MNDPAERMRDPRTRLSARVILINADDRVLLLHGYGTGTQGRILEWLTPGGRVEAGETLPVAAARELREETGLAVAPEELGAVVAVSSDIRPRGDSTILAIDSFFFLRVGDVVIDTTGHDEYERALIVGHRWWDVAGLRHSTERILPLGLADLVERLISGDIPDAPITLSWHR